MRWRCSILLSITLFSSAFAQTRPAFITGADANYSLEMQASQKAWSINGKPDDLFMILHRAGVETLRIRLWTNDDGVNGLDYATNVGRRAQAAGLKPYVVIFLSENWADMVKQPAPKVWKDLNAAAKAAAIEAYAERVARHFADAGVTVDLFEIGNEIDFGLCGVFEEEWPKRVSIPYMQLAVWSKMAPMILAAERGVNKVRPNAKFILHLAQWNKPDYCAAFWQTMITAGMQVDYAGLSYFPTSAAEPKERSLPFLLTQVDSIYIKLERPVVICESGYPSEPKFPGQFADWNKPIDGYTFDPAGQAKWLADYLAAAKASNALAGVFYWSPEWYDSEMWSAFALFDPEGKAKPAMKSLATVGPATRPTP